MSMPARILLVACCLTVLASCATNRFGTAGASPPDPKIAQCSAEALEPCPYLVADEGPGCDAALKADAVNRGRHIECQQRQRALIDCLRILERAGILTRKAPAR